ncbi:hypothetical protein BJ875DRAFT_469675 [Amylocarpus encephaloides]|uniref:Uncharacterized protein n=1 Tax=Amylocarpus encephaloides TaxID=45428 RepID=A0A9P7YDC0_9HELO|nr:hypothetical protein BJ875DRAFT_469675 [Amylocarpus encephaloides]
MSVPPTLPFYLHALIELPASLNFFFRPSEQLPTPAPQAHAIIRQYAVLLFTSNVIALVFALRPIDDTSKLVAAALALYHMAPLVRATLRIGRGDAYGQGLGGPWGHFGVHGVCLGGLVRLWLS